MEYFKIPYFADLLLSWYQDHKRALPWRDTDDPYKIWLSEIILQQTRVSQGLPYYRKFCQAFPKVTDLANATEQQVLRLWQGLGYYSRARNLHRCAQVITTQYHGKFPDSYQELLALPGVGDYTAAAIASFAFGQPTPVVDGNVFRVLSRLFGITHDIGMSKSKKIFKQCSSDLMGHAPPDTYNQAIMEFGALHCTPNQPKCLECPFVNVCFAYQNQLQHRLPVKSKKAPVRDRYFYYYVLMSGSSLLMKKRRHQDIWKGLYDFFLLEHHEATDPIELLENRLPDALWMNQIMVKEPSITYQHKLTHQRIWAKFVPLETSDLTSLTDWKKSLGLEKFDKGDVAILPKPILINNYLKAAIF